MARISSAAGLSSSKKNGVDDSGQTTNRAPPAMASRVSRRWLRKIVEAREHEEKSRAEAIAARLLAIEIAITRRVGDTEQLYGSVTAVDIAEFLKGKGFDIDRRKLILPDAIKALGEYDVPLKLHRDVTVPLKVRVVREGGAAAPAQA